MSLINPCLGRNSTQYFGFILYFHSVLCYNKKLQKKENCWSPAMGMEWVIFMCLWELDCFLSAWSKHKFSMPIKSSGELKSVYTFSSGMHIEGILDITVFSCLWTDWVTVMSRLSHFSNHCRNRYTSSFFRFTPCTILNWSIIRGSYFKAIFIYAFCY